MSKNKKSSQFSRVYRTDKTTLIPIIQGSPLFNAIITPEDFANGIYHFLGIDNKVDKLSGHSLVPDEEIAKLKALDISGELDLSSVELRENKQNSLEPDETELKYPTVKAVIEGLNTKVNIEEGKSLVDDLEIERLSTVTNQDVSNLVEKIEGYSLVKDTDIAKLEALTDTGEIDLSHLELAENKQNSLLEDTSGVKFPTVDAVNEGLATKVDKEAGKSLVDDEEILRLSSVVNQDISNLVEKEEGKSLILDTEIARLATLENVSIEHLATKEEVETKVDKEVGKSLVSDEEILRLSTVTNQNIEHLASKDELSNKVDKEIGKVLIEQTELTRLAGITNQDISHLATKGDLDNLVVKEEGKSLILDTEIERLESVTNQTLEGLGAEDVNNKKSIINEESDTEYPTSKAVADYVTEKVPNNDILNQVTATGTYILPLNRQTQITEELTGTNTFTLTEPFEGVVNESVVHFRTGSNVPTLAYDFTPKWLNEAEIELKADKSYTLVFEQLKQGVEWIIKASWGEY